MQGNEIRGQIEIARGRHAETARRTHPVLEYPLPNQQDAPWEIDSFDPDTHTLTLCEGEIEIHGDEGTDYYAPASMDVVLANGDNYVYVKIQPSAASPAASLDKSASKPESDANWYRKGLWYIVYDSTNKAITTMRPMHVGCNVEFSGWRPPYA